MNVTESAKNQILKNSKYIVILVDVGGCKGFLYEFFYSETSTSYFFLTDEVLTDEYSLSFLLNAELDFVVEVGFEGFVIKNSQFVTCGCGVSFCK